MDFTEFSKEPYEMCFRTVHLGAERGKHLSTSNFPLLVKDAPHHGHLAPLYFYDVKFVYQILQAVRISEAKGM